MKGSKKLLAFLVTFLMIFSNGFAALPVAQAAGNGKASIDSEDPGLEYQRIRTWNWTINNTVDVNQWNLLQGDEASSNFTVTVDKTTSSDTGALKCTIKVKNIDDDDSTQGLRIKISIYKVVKKYGIDTNQEILNDATVDVSSNPVLSPNEWGTYTYTYTFPSLPANGDRFRFISEAFIDNGTTFGGSATSHSDIIQFGNTVTSTVNDTIQVSSTDSPAGSPWTFSNDGSQTYSKTFGAAVGTGSYGSTATITQTGQASTATVAIDRKSLDVSKTATATYKTKYNWDITKTSPTSSMDLYLGHTANINYSVSVTATPQDVDFNATGIITVKNNSSQVNALLTGVADVLPSGIGSVVITDASEFPYTLAKGATLTLHYTATLPDKSSVVNTAKATAKTYRYSKSGGTIVKAEIGTKEYTGTANITFGSTPTELIDETATVTDSLHGSLGTLTAPASESGFAPFTYQLPAGPFTALGTYQLINTATLTTNDTGTVKTSTKTVDITVPSARLVIEKKDSYSDELLGGFQFGVYATEADAVNGVNRLQLLTTSSVAGADFGTALSAPLPLTDDTTTYWVKEMPLPAGSSYMPNSTVYRADLTYSGRTVPVRVLVDNDPYGSITVTKSFADDDKPTGSKTFYFQLWKNGSLILDNIPLTWVPDGENKLVFEDLDYGSTYTVKELDLTPGYDIDPDFISGVTAKIGDPNLDYSYDCQNTKLYGSITLRKAFQGTKPGRTEGYEVKIEGISGTAYSKTVVLNENGDPQTFTDLPWGGEFRITETDTATDGYALVDIAGNSGAPLTAADTFQLTDTIAAIDVTVTNKMLGSLTLMKSVPNYGTTASFYIHVVGKAGDTEVYNQQIAVPANSAAGVVINDLPYGDYTVTEDSTSNPANYKNLGITPGAFTIGDTAKTASVTVTNGATGSIEILKLDSRSTEGHLIPVAGTHFEIYSLNGTDKVMVDDDAVTDANGKITIGGLLVGTTYYARETAPAPGYTAGDGSVREYEILEPGATAGASEFVNTPLGSIVITKLDSRTEAKLSGFTFGIYPTEADAIAGTNQLDELTTSTTEGADFGTATSKALELTADVTSFWVKELSGQPGYAIDSTPHQVDIAFADRLSPTPYSQANDPQLKLAIYSYDAATVTSGGSTAMSGYDAATKLAGATFAVFTDPDCTIRAIPDDLVTALDPVSGDILVSVTLPFGGAHPTTYYVKQAGAAPGYIFDPAAPAVPITFIEGDPLTTIAIARFTSVRNVGSIVISKIDSLTKAPLADAEFTLYSDAAGTKQVGDPVATKADGIARFDGLEPGNYWIKETKAPKDYEGFPDLLPVKVVGGVTSPEPLTITNQYNPPEDIQTGMMDWNVLLLGGLALMAGVMLVLFTRRRRVTSIR